MTGADLVSHGYHVGERRRVYGYGGGVHKNSHTVSSVITHYYLPCEHRVLQYKSTGRQLESPWLMNSKSVWRASTAMKAAPPTSMAKVDGSDPGCVLLPEVQNTPDSPLNFLSSVCWLPIKWFFNVYWNCCVTYFCYLGNLGCFVAWNKRSQVGEHFIQTWFKGI